MRTLLSNLWTSESAARAFLFGLAEAGKTVFATNPYAVAGAIFVQFIALGVASKSSPQATFEQLKIVPKFTP